MIAAAQSLALKELAEKYSLTLAQVVGLGAGLYFEYFRRPAASPTHFITGLDRSLENALACRRRALESDYVKTIHSALCENARKFNLDRAPTIALMGMELLAEELPQFERIEDWRTCVSDMANTILETRALYRFTYVDFLRESAPHFASAQSLAEQLRDIADEWNSFAQQLNQAERDPSQLERASRMLRRLAFREEHFWGKVLDL